MAMHEKEDTPVHSSYLRPPTEVEYAYKYERFKTCINGKIPD